MSIAARVAVLSVLVVSAVAAAQALRWHPSSGGPTPNPRVISIQQIQADAPMVEQSVTVPLFDGETANALVELGPSAFGRCQLNVQRSTLRDFPITIEVGCRADEGATWALRSKTTCDSFDSGMDVSVPRLDGRGLITWRMFCRGPGDPRGTFR